MSQEERLRGKTNPVELKDNWRVTYANCCQKNSKWKNFNRGKRNCRKIKLKSR